MYANQVTTKLGTKLKELLQSRRYSWILWIHWRDSGALIGFQVFMLKKAP